MLKRFSQENKKASNVVYDFSTLFSDLSSFNQGVNQRIEEMEKRRRNSIYKDNQSKIKTKKMTK